MSADEHLSPHQFPLEQMHKMFSNDFEVPMRSVGAMMRNEWENGGFDIHPQDIAHGGPDNYVAHLAEDIAKNGMQRPIQVRDGILVKDGHHRYLAAVKAGLTHVPVEHIR